MRIINGGMGRTLQTIPFREIQFQLVPLIPYLAIAKTIVFRSLIFHIYTRVENKPYDTPMYNPHILPLSYRLSVNKIVKINANLD